MAWEITYKCLECTASVSCENMDYIRQRANNHTCKEYIQEWISIPSINMETFQFTNNKETNEQIKQLINDAYKKEQPLIKLPEWKKESDNKLAYELDWNFIEAMAKRMAINKWKYPPYNWQKPMDIESLKQALLRHTIEVMKGNYTDTEELDHLSAIACNAQFIYYQLIQWTSNHQ